MSKVLEKGILLVIQGLGQSSWQDRVHSLLARPLFLDAFAGAFQRMPEPAMTTSSAPAASRPSRRRRVLKALGLVAGLGFGAALVVGFSYRAAFGVRAGDRDIASLSVSPQWMAEDEVFENPEPLWNNTSVMAMIKAYQEKSPLSTPQNPAKEIPQGKPSAQELAPPSTQGVQVTWFGHSSMYLAVDGARFLIDPVWYASSPIPWLGPQRWFAPSLELKELPVPDAVVISHDHYDHLDYLSILEIKDWDTKFMVPLGVGAHLVMWGVDPSKVVEMDWYQEQALGKARVVCLPARHASGRGVFDQNATLWSGWAFVGPSHRVYYSGDTGLFDGMKEIGEKLGPFDLAMVEVGQYHPNWPDWHLGPEQAVLAATWVRGKRMLPVHWGAYDLAMHSWTAPVERTVIAAQAAGMDLVTPQAGVPLDAVSGKTGRWWTPDIPFKSAQEQPVVANRANGRGPHQELH